MGATCIRGGSECCGCMRCVEEQSAQYIDEVFEYGEAFENELNERDAAEFADRAVFYDEYWLSELTAAEYGAILREAFAAQPDGIRRGLLSEYIRDHSEEYRKFLQGRM